MLPELADAQPGRPGALDARRLAEELRVALKGEVRFDDGSRALYATDASNYRQVPIGVVIPRDTEDVVRAVALCRRYGAPVLSRGAGTSLCGQCCNVAVVIDFSKYLTRILEIDVERRIARVEPGVVLDDLRAAAEAHGLTFAPDPATHNHNTLGGMIGNNSCGPHSVMGGTTVDNVAALDVLTYDGVRFTVGADDAARCEAIVREGGRRGEIYARLRALGERCAQAVEARFPDIPRRVSGFNLDALVPGSFNLAQALVGSEGTCALVLEASLRLIPSPPARSLAVLGYPDVFRAADHVPEIMRAGPIALEGFDDRLVADMRALGMHPEKIELLPEGAGWLIVEFGGDTREAADAAAERLLAALREGDSPPTMKCYADPERQKMVWKIRESGLGATAHVPHQPLTWEGWEDSAVPPDKLGHYLRELRALLERYGYQGDLYGHFGQGCVHTRIDFDLESEPGIRKYRAFIEEAAHLVVSLGGSISGEHGDGQSKAHLLPIMFGEELVAAFREFKSIWDPAGKMNPGKVVGAYRADENLRLGTAWDPPAMPVHFSYATDHGDFSHALLRCVGVGECRKKDGLMCPSYMATGEEMHSTRGRAHLLWEMVNGDPLTRRWREPAVKEALDLCLSCKGCKSECPVKVDMAVYKAEFLAHYYRGRLRPPEAYAFGMIDRWARLAAHAPGVANFFTQRAPFAAIAKRVLGIPAERRIPPFAARPFTRTHRAPPPPPAGAREVILWPDTFNNYFHPEVVQAAAAVLAHAGFAVRLPPRPLCCGRPLYEHGMVGRARRYLEQVMEALAADIRVGTPIVGLEPACVSVFREELPQLMPAARRARRLAGQVRLLSEFLAEEAPDADLGRLERDALVQPHCHQQSVLGLEAEKTVLGRLGLRYRILESGCCGMAGSFGFSHDRYEVSMRCAERALLPAVRSAGADTLIIANGYSCGEQIRQSCAREPMHLAQVLAMAIDTR